MGFLDNLFKSMAAGETGPSGERPERGFGDVKASGSGEDWAEPEAQAQVVEAARQEDTANLARLVLEVPPRITVQPSRRFQTGMMEARTGLEGSQLIGFQPDRMRILIQNREDADQGVAVYLAGTAEEATAGSGFWLPGQAAIALETQAAIYVRTAADTATVDFIIEYGD